MTVDAHCLSNDIAQLRRPCVVISQPMYFPWVGLLEQVKLCDIFVYYDDVQFVRGFFNRVQVKTISGVRWLTVPLKDLHRGQRINEVKIDDRIDWRRNHREVLSQAYAKAPYKDEMFDLVDEVFRQNYESLADLSEASMSSLIRYWGLDGDRSFHHSSGLETPGSSTQRLVDLCLRLNAKHYLTGHGARHYLEHERFEASEIDVAYISYGVHPYPQCHGPFTPYVTALDLVAHCGKKGSSFIAGFPVPWRKFLAMKKESID